MSAQSDNIYLPYRLLFLYLEPTAAFAATLMAHFTPSFYLAVMSPHSAPSNYHPGLQIIFDQVAACYFLFGWIEAVVLRSTNNLKVWEAVLLGMLICDVLHLYGAWLAMGSLFWDLGAYRGVDWITVGSLVGLVVARTAFLMGVGSNEKGMAGKGKKVPTRKGL